MPIVTRVLLHRSGPALWPEHKPLDEVLELRDTTPEHIWQTTYQGHETPPSGSVFQRGWWSTEGARYDASDFDLASSCIARWISWDTAMKDNLSNAFTACVVGELLPDYRLVIREVWRSRMRFPDMPPYIEQFARRYNAHDKLRGIIIEDIGSGTSSLQTLAATSEQWIRRLLVPFSPNRDKETRYQQAAVWCKNGSVLLPYPHESVPWLMDFEDELFTVPGSEFKDQADAFAQLVIYVENLLSEGYKERSGRR